MNETRIPNDEWKFIKDSVYNDFGNTTKKLIDVCSLTVLIAVEF